MTVQSIASIVRQIVAVAALIIGPLTSAVTAMHLPPAVSAVITAAGAGILWLEHYLGSLSLGTTVTHTTVPGLSANPAVRVIETAEAKVARLEAEIAAAKAAAKSV